jgi:hypothetical protein
MPEYMSIFSSDTVKNISGLVILSMCVMSGSDLNLSSGQTPHEVVVR